VTIDQRVIPRGSSTELGKSAFDLKYYTEARDLGYLLSSLESERGGEKMRKLNTAMVELIDEYGLVGFETLAVEVSRSSRRCSLPMV
jgi:hypothetical protein